MKINPSLRCNGVLVEFSDVVGEPLLEDLVCRSSPINLGDQSTPALRSRRSNARRRSGKLAGLVAAKPIFAMVCFGWRLSLR